MEKEIKILMIFYDRPHKFYGLLNQLSEGDLVFFSTKKKGVISHVGIYIGMGQFIHAPAEGKEIRMESLSTDYYQSRYIGARTYL